MQITKEMLDLAISLKACKKGIERAMLGFEFLTFQDRCWVAYNPSAPAAILEKLSTDKNEMVRYNVACNPSTPASVLEQLSAGEDYWIRYNVARNPTWIAYKKTV